MKSDVPKVLHLFNNKPMLVSIIQTTYSLNPSKIVIVTGKFHELIKSTLADYFDVHNSIIDFVIQQEPLGTGDAIRTCLPFFEKHNKILILNGDMPLINKDVLEKFILNGSNFDINILVAKLPNPTVTGILFTIKKMISLKLLKKKTVMKHREK
jgi:bifunctional UDP-N-acetylglucosamine pyrophosphorylase/glucosamine-1-phosphate N-acetyltransferase